ncbi:MAG: hypothetical protein RLY86_2253 [Pseudomonadota bacterium]|jgi:type I restriction enzyme S subunit
MERWKTMTLREAGVALIDCVHATPPAVDEGYPYISIPQMKNGRIDFGSARRISESDFVEWTKKARPQLHDVVLSRRTNPGVTATFGDQCDFALGQNLVLLRADEGNVAPEYLRWLTTGPSWWEQIDKYINVGAVFDSLRCADVPKFELPIPPKSEQLKIAALLSALDDKIELNRRTNETLEAMARALFRDWFVEFGPTRAKMEGRPPYLAPDLWSLFPDRLDEDGKPEGWHSGTVSDLILFGPSEQLSRDITAPYLDMAALPTRGPAADMAVPRAYTSGPRFRNGDTLLARITPCLENGKTAFVQDLPNDAVGWGSTEFIVMRSIPPVPPFISYLIARDDDFRSHAIRSMTGTSGRQRADVGQIARYAMAIPAREVLWNELSKAIGPLVDAIKANTEESRTLATLRDLLLPKLVSGEIRVKDAEGIVGEVT